MAKKNMVMTGMLAISFTMMASGAAWCAVPMRATGVIFDTKLIWLQNANCFGKQSWADAKSRAASLKSGDCGIKDSSTPGHWRLPTKDELINRVKDMKEFTNVQDGNYWTSTTSGSKYKPTAYSAKKNGELSESQLRNSQYLLPVRDRY